MVDWGSIADWASAVGSVSACGVALYLARSAQRVSMNAFCGYRVLAGAGEQVRLASISVTNTGERPFKISCISISYGLFMKKHGVIKLGAASNYCDRLLVQLNDGDSSHFGVPIEGSNWFTHLADECGGWLEVATIRVTIHCTNGQKHKIRPEPTLRKMILDGVSNRQAHKI